MAGTPAGGIGAAAVSAVCRPSRSDAAARCASRSALVTRPPMPVPATWATSIPCSSAMRRTTGDERARSSSISSAIAPLGRSAAGDAAVADRVSRSPSAVQRSAPPVVASVVSAGAPAPGDRSAPAPASSIRQRPAPTGTVVSGSTRISTRTPATGDGISALTLSVTTSSSGSYLSTRSPIRLRQFPIVPSVTLSPSCGIVIVVAVSIGMEPSGGRAISYQL